VRYIGPNLAVIPWRVTVETWEVDSGDIEQDECVTYVLRHRIVIPEFEGEEILGQLHSHGALVQCKRYIPFIRSELLEITRRLYVLSDMLFYVAMGASVEGLR
jgi:hypothetical protein